MKKVLGRSVLIILVLSIFFCCSCETNEQEKAAPPTKNAQISSIGVEQSKEVSAVSKDNAMPAAAGETQEQPVQEKAAAKTDEQVPDKAVLKSPLDIVAEIGDYKITRGQLEKNILLEYSIPSREDSNNIRLIDRDTVLRKMLAEKATIIKGRDANELEDPFTKYQMDKFRNDTLAEMLMKKYLQENLVVNDQEIENKIKSDPNLTREAAHYAISAQKSREMSENYYQELLKKANPQKIKENYATAVKANYTMVSEGMKADNRAWIKQKQVAELPRKIKDTPLATFDNGTVTVEDFFVTLCEFSPPKRPANLNSYKAFDEMLEKAFRVPIFAAEAKRLGLDKDDSYLSKIREREDRLLLVNEKIKRPKLSKPTEEEIKAYFEQNRDKFVTPRTIKTDVIWCNDLQTAEKARTELDKGAGFQELKGKYSLNPRLESNTVTPGMENIFFNDLWAAEPNQVVGPIKGVYKNEPKWRVVKILEKKNAEKPKEYSTDISNKVEYIMQNEKYDALFDDEINEMLQKYKYKIYADVLMTVDPLDIQ